MAADGRWKERWRSRLAPRAEGSCRGCLLRSRMMGRWGGGQRGEGGQPGFQVFRFSGFQGSRFSGYQVFRVPGYQGFSSRVPGFQFLGSRVSWFQGFMVSWFQGFRVPGFQGFRVPGFRQHQIRGGGEGGVCVCVGGGREPRPGKERRNPGPRKRGETPAHTP